MNKKSFRHLEINGVAVCEQNGWRLSLPPIQQEYADAQIDDYGVTAVTRRHLPYKPNTHLRLRARFSHPIGILQGTAGFGFWNIPFADPTIKTVDPTKTMAGTAKTMAGTAKTMGGTVKTMAGTAIKWPALPQATWFFYGSAPTDLPLSPSGKGQGWFAATLDATTPSALSMIPIAPFVLLANQVTTIRKKLWPLVQCQLGIDYTQIEQDITQWHSYELIWKTTGCQFIVDNIVIMNTKQSPRGPLGFVCWIDNQFMIITSQSKIKWGILPIKEPQWLQISSLEIK